MNQQKLLFMAGANEAFKYMIQYFDDENLSILCDEIIPQFNEYMEDTFKSMQVDDSQSKYMKTIRDETRNNQ